MTIIQRIAEARRDFILGCGFEPERIVMTADDAREVMESCAPLGGDRIFGMRIELGDKLQCRAERIAA